MSMGSSARSCSRLLRCRDLSLAILPAPMRSAPPTAASAQSFEGAEPDKNLGRGRDEGTGAAAVAAAAPGAAAANLDSGTVQPPPQAPCGADSSMTVEFKLLHEQGGK
mmetsp:Transcript_22497/g.57521  ORF Transcript_22497/g.57521 Transcript_22497/m.57521 type:complete len:108 (+) Transcript_22497:2182-2505(+)